MLEIVSSVALASTSVANLSKAFASSASRSTVIGASTLTPNPWNIAWCVASSASTVASAAICHAKDGLTLAWFIFAVR